MSSCLQRFVWLPAAAALLLSAASAQTTTSSSTVTRESSFPPVGLASSETMQVNVVNVATASQSGTAASCTGTVSFINSGGTTIGTAASFTIASGHGFSASLPYAQAGSAGTRAEIRGVVTLTSTAGSGVPCALVSSLETYDTATGVTHVLLGGPAENAGNLGAGPIGGGR